MSKIAIVTGASGNMGQAVVEKFLNMGYQVIGTVVPNDPVPLNISHAQFEKVVADLMDETASGKFINDIIDKYTTIDVAVLTVGGFAMGKIADSSSADILKQVKLNFETAYHVHPEFSFGKPNPEILAPVLQQYSSDEILLVGDRLYTDFELAIRSGCRFALALCGETSRDDLARQARQPDIVAETVADIDFDFYIQNGI
jgi:hypothetical protein